MTDALKQAEPFDADEFMQQYEWAKWSDCREMVEDAYGEWFNAGKRADIAAPQAVVGEKPCDMCAVCKGWEDLHKYMTESLNMVADERDRAVIAERRFQTLLSKAKLGIGQNGTYWYLIVYGGTAPDHIGQVPRALDDLR